MEELSYLKGIAIIYFSRKTSASDFIGGFILDFIFKMFSIILIMGNK